MSITWRAAAAGLEAAMAVCAALNLVYFLRRGASLDSLSRKVAAFVLALVSFGVLAESAFVIAALGASADKSVFATAAWVVTRLTTFAGTAYVSWLVLGRMGGGKG